MPTEFKTDRSEKNDQRRTVLALACVVFGFTTGEFVIAGILPAVADGLSVSVPAAGLAVTAYAAGMIVGGPVVTVLTARVPRTRLIAALVVVSIVGNTASALAPGYAVLLAARVVSGLVVATFFAVAITIAIGTAEPGREASTVARVTLGLNLGIVLGAPLGTVIGERFGWRATFAAVAAFIALALVLVLRFVPSQPPGSRGPAARELRLLARRDVQGAIALTALGNVGVTAVFTYLAPLLTEVSGFATSSVPVLLLVYGLGAVAGNFAGGRLADRALLPAITGLLVALAAVLALFGVFGHVRVAAVGLVFVLGVLAFAIIPGMQTKVMASAQGAPTLAVAVNASGFQLAAAFAGWLGGRVIDSSLGLRALPYVGALLTVSGVAVASHALLRERRAAAGRADRSPERRPAG